MSETLVEFNPPLVSSGARLKGNARGAMVCAVFGSAWMFWTAAFVPTARTAALALVTIVTLLICGWAPSRVRVARRYKDSAADKARWAAIAPLFWVDTAAEWVLGAGAVFALASFGRYSLIPQFLGVIIGLHFLPLARLLRAPRYYVMGTAMILCVLASLLIPEGNIRNVTACAGIGLPMWITAVAILSQDKKQSALEEATRVLGTASWENVRCSPVTLVSETNLKARWTPMVVFWGFLNAVSLTTPKRLNAQSAPGPIVPAQSQEQSPAQPPQPAGKPKQPQVPARTTLAGPWKLNRDESDDPRQRVRAAEGSSTGNTGGYPGGGNTGGYPGGYPSGGRRGGYPYPGGGGGGPYGGQRNTGQDIEDNPKMQPLMYSSESLNIELKNSEVDVTDDQFHNLILYTDGRQLQKSTDNHHQEVAAHWNGSQLVSDEKSPLGGKMSRTFELSQDGRNLQETLHIDNGRSKTPLLIRYVYDVASSDMQTGSESDPNRPVLKKHPDDTSNSPQ